jgi:exodeoxyribonuclease-3
VRIATWNVNSVTARLPRLLDWLGIAEPDVLCLQELKCSDDAFPHEEVGELGYEAATHCAGRWNGVGILSRVGLEDVVCGLPDEPDFLEDGAMFGAPQRRAIGATCNGVRLWSLYVPNGREVGHAHFEYKLQWLAALRSTAVAELSATPFALLGDFNVAPTDDDVWDIGEFAGSTHVSEAERKELQLLREAGLVDVFPRALKGGHPYTYWDYRQLAFAKNKGMRIDLVYANESFTTAITDAYVDREARKGNAPSDHAPVVVDLEL